RFEQHSARMAAGIADDVSLLGRIGDRLVGDSRKSESFRVHPQSVLTGVMNDYGAIRDGAIQKFMRRRRRWHGAEIRPAKQEFVSGMARGVALDLLDEDVRVVRSNA